MAGALSGMGVFLGISVVQSAACRISAGEVPPVIVRSAMDSAVVPEGHALGPGVRTGREGSPRPGRSGRLRAGPG